MTILEKIIADKKVEVDLRKNFFPSITGKNHPFSKGILIPLLPQYNPVARESLLNIKDVPLLNKI